jgi:hypothetical protein
VTKPTFTKRGVSHEQEYHVPNIDSKLSFRNRAARRTLKMPKTLLSIDSTTITVGKTRLPWAVYHGKRSGIKLHVSFSNETGMPLQIVETTDLKHDGPIGKQLEDKRFILVGDRA